MADFGYCFDCKELNYAISDKNGVFEFNNMSSNHYGHNCHTFGAPNKYSPPIRNILTKLNANAPIHNNEIVIFKLAIGLGDLDKYNKYAEEETVENKNAQLDLF